MSPCYSLSLGEWDENEKRTAAVGTLSSFSLSSLAVLHSLAFAFFYRFSLSVLPVEKLQPPLLCYCLLVIWRESSRVAIAESKLLPLPGRVGFIGELIVPASVVHCSGATQLCGCCCASACIQKDSAAKQQQRQKQQPLEVQVPRLFFTSLLLPPLKSVDDHCLR